MVLGGIVVEGALGVVATSDGDVAVHALIDALLGAANLGDLGTHFPSDDLKWHGADSLRMLGTTHDLLVDAGFDVAYVDVTVIAQDVRVAPQREAMATKLAFVLGLERSQVSVKATTTDGLGFLGRGEGIAAMVVATLRSGQE